MTAFLVSLRPRQWVKNFFIFSPLLFDAQFTNLHHLLKTTAAFFLFCFLSGSLYIFNDIRDIEKDRQHPRKKSRPIAAGQLSVTSAFVFACALLSVSLIISYVFFPTSFFICAVLYVFLNILYTSYLKTLVIVDVLCISIGFVLRIMAGVFVIASRLSSWILVCAALLALFMALIKRRHELVLLGENAGNHRASLSQYSVPFLDQMIASVSSSTLLAYALYSFSSQTAKTTHYMILSLPFVIYGLFRYMYLSYEKNQGGEPETLVMSDAPFLLNIALWIIACALILYFGKNIQTGILKY